MKENPRKDNVVKLGSLNMNSKVINPTTIVERTIEYYKKHKMLLILSIVTIVVISYFGSYLSGIKSFLYSFSIGIGMLVWFPSWKEKIIKTEIEKTKG